MFNISGSCSFKVWSCALDIMIGFPKNTWSISFTSSGLAALHVATDQPCINVKLYIHLDGAILLNLIFIIHLSSDQWSLNIFGWMSQGFYFRFARPKHPMAIICQRSTVLSDFGQEVGQGLTWPSLLEIWIVEIWWHSTVVICRAARKVANLLSIEQIRLFITWRILQSKVSWVERYPSFNSPNVSQRIQRLIRVIDKWLAWISGSKVITHY